MRAVGPTRDRLDGITIVARGSSDHAAVYGRYLLEAATGKPVSLAAPSLHTLYDVDVDYRGQLVIAVSQSGATPEIVQTLEALQAGGGRGLAITNQPDSPLARAARRSARPRHRRGASRARHQDRHRPAHRLCDDRLRAGTVPFSREELDAVPAWVQAVLDDPAPVVAAAVGLAGASQLIIVARGYLYAAALETALKIKETCSLTADGYSAADLRHGPIAAVTRGLPVVALCTSGPALTDMPRWSTSCGRAKRAC